MQADAGLLCCRQDSGLIERLAQNSPERGEKMFTNRLFTLFVILSLVLVAAFTVRGAVATSAVGSNGFASYDQVERIRSIFSPTSGVDYSYDEVEHLRAAPDAADAKPIDASYDEVEHNRSARDTALIEPADTSYDEVEHIRSAATVAAAVDSLGTGRANMAAGIIALHRRQELADSTGAGVVHENMAEGIIQLHKHQELAADSTGAGAGVAHENIAERAFELRGGQKDRVPLSPGRVRAEIPSGFIQPVVPYDPSEIFVDDYVRDAGPHNLRDEIPSEFIQPVAP
jgi:hypothetical protein